jgi:hypothetical protein
MITQSLLGGRPHRFQRSHSTQYNNVLGRAEAM